MRKPAIHVIETSSLPIFEQLQIEEGLLRADAHNWCFINKGSPPAVVLGISNKEEEHLNASRIEKSNISVIRRFTGGGSVVVDHDTLFISLICNKSAVAIDYFPSPLLCWNGTLYKKALAGLEFRIQENDYVIGIKKFGGNAQYLSKDRWVHHSTLLWDFCTDNMQHLKLPPKMPSYREKREHQEFLCPLNAHLSCKETFIRHFFESLEEHFTLVPSDYEKGKEVLKRNYRRSTKNLDIKKLLTRP